MKSQPRKTATALAREGQAPAVHVAQSCNRDHLWRKEQSSHAIFGLLADNAKGPINTNGYIYMWCEHLSSET